MLNQNGLSHKKTNFKKEEPNHYLEKHNIDYVQRFYKIHPTVNNNNLKDINF